MHQRTVTCDPVFVVSGCEK